MGPPDRAAAPQRKTFLYHESSIKSRESIRASGLRASVPANARDLPKGVYMAPLSHSEYGSSMEDASHWGFDRWRVDTTGLDLHVDQSQPTATKFHPSDVEPSRLRLAKKAHPNWSKHVNGPNG